MEEQVQWKRKASKFSRKDVISIVPDDVITNIMNRLPIQDAVKTSILSKNWRAKWTYMLTEVVFDENFFDYLPNEYGWEYIIRRLLHDLKGPIAKFVLYIPRGKNTKVADIDRWFKLLSLKGIKELTLENAGYNNRLRLSTKLYACMQLKHLKLSNCCFRDSPTFRGFPNLFSLELWYVKFKRFTFEEFTARCPLLESLILGPLHKRTRIKLVEILKLVNLKMLSFGSNILESAMISSSSSYKVMIPSASMFQLTSLPKLQELHLNFDDTKMFAQDGAQKMLSTAFLCLKTLKLSDVDFASDIMSSFVAEMICGSKNLQNLEIKAVNETYLLPSEPCSLELDHNKIGQLPLRSVVLDGFTGLENQLVLIKFILDCSPFLKKFSIRLDRWFFLRMHVINHENGIKKTDAYKIFWEQAKKLLKLHRASAVAEIEIE